MSSADETIQRRVLNSVALMIPDLALNATPPEIAQQVYRIVSEITGNNDPYLEAKNCANKSALSLYTYMKDIVADSNETLETACKLAIAGNAIDLGAQAEYCSIRSIFENSVESQLDQEQYRKFEVCVSQASLILYLADNAGEIVFDRILIEQLLQIKKSKIVFVVREKPIITESPFPVPHRSETLPARTASITITNNYANRCLSIPNTSFKVLPEFCKIQVLPNWGL